MEHGGENDKQIEVTTSYRYWVREATGEAAPIPVPRKLSTQEVAPQSQHPALGSVWNKAGTWEEKNLNKWATDRIKELLGSIGSVDFSSGKAHITEVTKCTGDAYLVTVRNKKRVGYTYEITLKVKGEWVIGDEVKAVSGHVDFLEFSFGELDDLVMEVRLSEDKDLLQQDKMIITQDLKKLLKPAREKLVQFEEELKDR